MIKIDNSANVVFDFLTDFENYPKWQNGIQSCHISYANPINTGSRYQQKSIFLDKTFTSTFEVTKFQPNISLQVQSIRGPIRSIVSHKIEEQCSGVSLKTITTFYSTIGLEIAEPLLRWILKKQIQNDLQQLKQLIEKPIFQPVLSPISTAQSAKYYG